MLEATALVYSSHNRSQHIHRDWIVERALQSHDNKTLFYLPMSMGRQDQQDYSWGTFKWFLNQYKKWGLEPTVFFWSDDLTKEDVDICFDHLLNDEVVILGGGNPKLGYDRYTALGDKFYGDPDRFNAILWQREQKGLLTAGFSAGASQLCEYLGASGRPGYGLARNIVTTLHHEHGREGDILHLAQRFPHCMAFGLPNDSGVASEMGRLPSGNIWQIIEFVIDTSWDIPEDNWHIKTRQGMKIEHYYPDGRQWSFNGGDRIVRIMAPDNSYQDAWIFNIGGIYNYWSQQPSGYQGIDHIFASH